MKEQIKICEKVGLNVIEMMAYMGWTCQMQDEGKVFEQNVKNLTGKIIFEIIKK